MVSVVFTITYTIISAHIPIISPPVRGERGYGGKGIMGLKEK